MSSHHNTRSKSTTRAAAENLEILTQLAASDSSSSSSEENSTAEIVKVVKVTPVKKTDQSAGNKKGVAVVSRSKCMKEDKLKKEVAVLRSLKKELEKEAVAQRREIIQLEHQNRANQKWEDKFNKVKYEVQELKGQKKSHQGALEAKESQRKADLAAAALKAKEQENELKLKINIQTGKIAELKGLLDQQSREIMNLNKREQANIQLEQRHAQYMMAEEHKKRAAEQK